MAKSKSVKRKTTKKTVATKDATKEVMTFADITDRERHHDNMAVARAMAEKVVDTVREAMLVLDTDLRVVSANDSFYRTFQVSRTETVGQLVFELGNHQWDIPELRRLLENVLPEQQSFNDFEVDHRFETIGRKVMLLNARKINHMQRILLAIQDVTEHRMASEFIRLTVEALPVAAVMFEPSGNIVLINEQTEELFGYDRSKLLGQTVEMLIPEALREQDIYAPDQRPMGAGHDLFGLRNDGSRFPIEVAFSPVDTPRGPHVLAAIFDTTQRKRTQVKLQNLNVTLGQQVEQRSDMLRLLQDITRSANEARTVEDATRAALERIAQHNGWQVGHVWRLADDGSGDMVSSGIWHVGEGADRAIARLQDFQETCAACRFAPGEPLIGAVASSNEVRWIDDIVQSRDWRRGNAAELGLHAVIAFPVTVNKEVVAVLEFFSDHAARREERFMEIMPDVGIQLGHVVERKRLEKLAADASEVEQRRIGSDIHDGVGQLLTGLRFLAQTHTEMLAEQASPEVKTAKRMTEWLENVQQQLRSVVRKLVPVEIDERGLVAALRLLAAQTSQTYDLECTFEFPQSIRVADTTLATHIFRIAQEAVRNAVRHAEAGRIQISLSEDAGVLKLQIDDDGVGIEPLVGQKEGFGLRSMAYRAGLIGGNFDCQPREEGGTRVICAVLRGV